ncbi:MAG: hypothetical protein JWR09_2478 [Mucilaginibacter sp.]|nr:hypothetical protein [Mucilaginibacter sp.]
MKTKRINIQMRWLVSVVFMMLFFQSAVGQNASNNIYQFDNNAETRWSSPENLNGKKGNGGKENGGAKGHPSDSIAAGSSKSLLDIQGSGIINRIWITISDRSPQMLRSLKIEMFWDNEKKPAVSAPFGDFFGAGLGRTTAFQNVFFADPEGRSFICYIPMPFKKAARIVVTNESRNKLRDIYFDVNYSILPEWNNTNMYFHAYWHRDTATVLAQDFELLPAVKGRGRFLGVNIGVNANPLYRKSWFGEGEVKMYLDGDKDFPSINGTGTEDYIGTGWGQGKFINQYSGCTFANDTLLQWAFYRFHIPDPVYFKTDCLVTMQQVGGDMRDHVLAFQLAKAPLIPITIYDGKLHTYYKKGEVLQLSRPGLPNGWTNFYRSDDVSSTAYFYLDTPTDGLPAIQLVAIRKTQLRDKPAR